jgi:hypothetical protein
MNIKVVASAAFLIEGHQETAGLCKSIERKFARKNLSYRIRECDLLDPKYPSLT